MRGALGGPRVLLRRLREVMAEPVSAQERLDKVVVLIAANMVAEVCSVYVLRVDGTLELYATEGLKREAVHETVLKSDEGLVGLVASEANPINLSDAQAHPAFSFRPETGEEIYHSFLGVPVLRAGNTLGVLVVQNRARRTYTEEEEEALQTTAMVLAEMIASGELSSIARPGAEPIARHAIKLEGTLLSDGIALGHVVLHEPRVVITNVIADDVPKELKRLDAAIATFRADLDRLLDHGEVAEGGEHREVLEAYRMFGYDQGWLHKMREAVSTGLTAEAGVERVQSDTRARMLRASDPYLRDRLHDLDDLANRLMRVLMGQDHAPSREQLPENAILVARSMGPAALLDYDRKRLRGLILEEGGPTSHVSIVARALGIPAVGEIANATGLVEPGDAIIVDGTTGDVHLRPPPDIQSAYGERAKLRARRQAQYRALRDRACVTKDGHKVALMINAGLPIDLPHLDETGAVGIGLFRTELQFMVADTLPRTGEQLALYRSVLEAAGKRPVTFRTLDIGGDKVLPYMRNVEEENPALGWRAIRLGLDRPGLLRCSGARAAARRRRARIASDVPDDRHGGGIRQGQGPGRDRVDASAPARPRAARARADRHHAGSAGAPVPTRRIARPRRFPVGRIQRPDAVPLCRRPRQRAGIAALRSAVDAGAARAQGHRRQGARTRQTRGAVRRACFAADRRAGAGDYRLPLAVAVAFGGRPGQGAAARARLQKRRERHLAFPRATGRQRLHPPQARGLRGGRGAAALIALPQHRLDALLARHELVERELATNLARDDYVKLSREFSELGPVIEAIKAYRAVTAEIADLDALAGDAATDAEMRKMAEAEKPALIARRDRLERQIQLALIPKDAMDDHDAILEIRAGTGGDEAALFAGDLFRMYERYAAKQGWKTEVLSISEGTKGGFKEIVAEVHGRGVFAKLKFESGVHRVQRVPDTEASGRIHTSAATVAVLPEVEDVDIGIDEKDLKIDTMRAQGAGGQHVNKTESAIRITHLPSGIVVFVQEERSQHKNKSKAMTMLRAKLYDQQRSKLDAARAAERRGQIGSGDRSERIRTYNFPQGRVTDHRINLTLHKLPQVMEGEALHEVIDALVTEHQAELLAAEGAT